MTSSLLALDGSVLCSDLPEEDYHADPALSSSGARRLARATPARFRWERDHPNPPTDAMVLGSAVHTLVLESGPCVVEIEHDSWRTNAAKDAGAQARAAGQIPLLTKDYRRAQAMAQAVLVHPLAGALLAAAEHRELSGFWTDETTGVPSRVRFDAVSVIGSTPVLVDLKSSRSIEAVGEFARAVDRYGYDQQHAWYCQAAAELGLVDGWPDFVFVLQEKDPPYFTAVRRLDPAWVERGYLRNARAREVFARCTEAGDWPAYPIEIENVPMSRWASAE